MTTRHPSPSPSGTLQLSASRTAEKRAEMVRGAASWNAISQQAGLSSPCGWLCTSSSGSGARRERRGTRSRPTTTCRCCSTRCDGRLIVVIRLLLGLARVSQLAEPPCLQILADTPNADPSSLTLSQQPRGGETSVSQLSGDVQDLGIKCVSPMPGLLGFDSASPLADVAFLRTSTSGTGICSLSRTRTQQQTAIQRLQQLQSRLQPPRTERD
jgi:hypothetical protein